MKIKYDFNCETCKSKDICKYYTETSKYCKKELDVKLKPKEEASKENLIITINCKHYNSEESTLNYPYGVRGFGEIPYINTSEKTPETYLDPNNTTGSPYPMQKNITISNNIENGIENMTAIKAFTEFNGSEAAGNFSNIITHKKHI